MKTHIESATAQTDGKPAPYCDVVGYVEPAVRFEVRLPLHTWTQRFVQTGCGGLCGELAIRLGNADGCSPASHGELALASTDMGHSDDPGGEFGKDGRLRLDFAYLGVHETTLAAKALIFAFYGQSPKHSYFTGCSDGGREALMEAQRYPLDFNGIAAGAPAMNFTTQNTFYHGWNAVKNLDENGKPILTAEKLPILHRAAIEACDAADGLKDGLISDPINCHVNPAVVECKTGKGADHCLSHSQVEVAKAIYKGAHDAEGKKLVLSGPLPGSELAWAGVYIPFPGMDRIMSAMISTGSLKYLVYQKNPPATYTLNDLKFTAEVFKETTQLHGIYDATDPDLSAFEKNGGKLILWHGLADPHISPLNTIAYYTAMNRVMGDAKVQEFARLYLFPGGYHCGGGEGPFSFDLMGSIMAWVESGKAPFELMATHQIGREKGPIAGVPSNMPSKDVPMMAPPRMQGSSPGEARDAEHIGPPPEELSGAEAKRDDLASGLAVDRTRPVYPYPLTARYKGTGTIDDAANFELGPAQPIPASSLEWLGQGFFVPHYQQWCHAQGAETLNCSSKP